MYVCAHNVDLFNKGEGLWKETGICTAGITITAVMKRIHYAPLLIRMRKDRAG